MSSGESFSANVAVERSTALDSSAKTTYDNAVVANDLAMNDYADQCHDG